ncbi:hypothetical protein C1H46_043194 [Malus baccata]|uniref:Uncharacterized protein n=1 Tax=Malus baccata TaxID=106549 RepID=A0A540KAM7_MALBA|nr:hypothetical protein C1H46_043194 [Malus baccata]
MDDRSLAPDFSLTEMLLRNSMVALQLTTLRNRKAYVHDFLDANNRPVLIVDASNHLSAVHDPVDKEKLCVFLIEKVLGALPERSKEILGIVNLRWVQRRKSKCLKLPDQ